MVNDVEELVELIKSLDPVITEVFKTVKAHSGELRGLVDGISEWNVSKNIKAMKSYRDAGLSEAAALLLMIDARASLSRALDNATAASKSKK